MPHAQLARQGSCFSCEVACRPRLDAALYGSCSPLHASACQGHCPGASGACSRLSPLLQGGQGGQGGGFNPLGGMGGQMDFMKNKAKFQEDPDTGITFDDVAVSLVA